MTKRRSPRNHKFFKIENGLYRNGRFSIVNLSHMNWQLQEEFDGGGNSILHEGSSKAECMAVFNRIIEIRRNTKVVRVSNKSVNRAYSSARTVRAS